MALQIGQTAPVINLYDTEKNKVSTADYIGKNLVILFFPNAFSSICTKELCSVRDNISFYENVDACVFGISGDSLFSLGKFKEDQQLSFPLLSDYNNTASRDYDALYEVFPAFEMEGVSKRAAFVVDKKGVLQYAEICASPGDIPNFEAIQKVLATI